jgi:hypothetical protein
MRATIQAIASILAMLVLSFVVMTTVALIWQAGYNSGQEQCTQD